MKPSKPEQKKGGSAIKQIKAKLAAAGVFNKLQRVSKKASQKSLQHSASNRKEAKSILKNLSQKTQVNNPFEHRFAKEKHHVVGRNMKGVVGKPGQVRARNQQIRQNTLALEMKNKNRENVLVDRRFGERDPGMSTEDKMLERFMKEKTKKMKSGTSFNLEDDEEVLTHMGQSLDNITSFDDAGLEEMSDDGNIDPSIVKFTHFGGFEEDKDPNVRKSRNEIMKEVIQKSKMYKKERQRQKEEDLNIAEEVDADLDTIRGLLAPMTDVLPASEGKMKVSAGRLALISGKTPDEIPQEAMEFVKPKADEDYDRFVREMQYDRRAKPTDRTKTEEELAQEAKEELEKLEADRIRRMEGKEVEDGGKKKKFKREHRESQADDLGYEEMPKPEAIQPLTYKDGVLVNKEIFMKPKRQDSDEEDSEETSEGSSDGESEGSSDEEQDEDGSSETQSENVESGDEEFFDGIEDSKIIEGFQNEDLENDESDENYQTALEDMYDESDEEASNKAASKKRSVESSKAAAELPYTFAAPETYQQFLELIDGRPFEDQKTIFNRILILYHTKLSKDNIIIQERLMEFVLEHIIHVGSSIPFDYQLLQFYQKQSVLLCRKFPGKSAAWYRSFVHTLNDKLNKSLSKHPKKSGILFLIIAFPSPGELLILRNVADIFSTSDLQHTVVTPCMLLLAQYLEQSPIINIKDAVSGMILCNIFYRRFVPEIMNYLNFIVLHTLDINEKQERRKIHTLKNLQANLKIEDFGIDFSNIEFDGIYNTFVIEETDELRLAILGEALVMLKLLCKLYSESTVTIELFDSLSCSILEAVPEGCNDKLKVILESYKRTVLPLVDSAKLKRRPLQYQKRKAMPIKTYNPKFHVGYSLDKKYDPDRDRAEQSKLKAEYKKEFKGAVRELRKDAAFLGRAKVEKIKEKDREYKKKMDKIKGILAEQEGAMRGYEKEAKKGKKKR
ncbi:nucleolar complex protein 14 [Boothiomyces macroporosus]|uniref:Nucleolar complex protein 14 n=1 Tax=Boothiomyces macroporosus TaxID=261099 RepID=A0AAD5ULE4_9FUNG|nr:nucleolar complex protein 14 [Boothiomyces macroporosus]